MNCIFLFSHFSNYFMIMNELSINLRDLLVSPINKLPEFVNYNNCIYYILNLIDGKGYIGQAKWFYGRFVANGWLSHKYSISSRSTHLYNAIRKYKSRNFKVIILEYNLNPSNLDRHENYWIKYYHTCLFDLDSNNGYNMNFGGEDHSHLREALKTKYPSTNGMPDSVIEKGRIKLKSLYPMTNGAPPQWIEAVKRFNKSRSESVTKAQVATKKEKYKDDPRFINGILPKSAVINGSEAHSQNCIIRTINNYISDLINKGLEVTPYNYYNNTYAGKSMWNQHIPRVLSRLDKLKLRNDWTDKLSLIFDHITPNPDKNAKGSNKFIII